MPEDKLTQALWGTVEAGKERGYVSHIFMRMLSEHGGRETAKRLLATTKPQTGLFELHQLGLLHESMEAVVLQDQFRDQFTKEELAVAHQRLADLRYFDPKPGDGK